MKVLVTGATGFLAGHCIQQLIAAGHDVRATVRGDPAHAVPHLLLDRARPVDGVVKLVHGDLESDVGWRDAAQGCDFVWHIASPFPPKSPRTAHQLIRPAVDGTLRVLQAAHDVGVSRVVMTSSLAAVAVGHEHVEAVTEADWSDLDQCQPYQRSKTMAEQAAWRYASRAGLDLVTIIPGQILGPLLQPQRPTSLELITRMLEGHLPLVPNVGISTVDVRDVARAHLLATETASAAGRRYLCSGQQLKAPDLARILDAEYRPQGRHVSTREMPYCMLWAAARVSGNARLALTYAKRHEKVDTSRATRELGWTARPVRDTVLDTAASLLRHGVV